MPKFEHAADALRYLDEQILSLNARLLRLEGENRALESALKLVWHILPDDETRNHVALAARKLSDDFRAKAVDADESTQKLIAAAVMCLDGIFLGEISLARHPQV